MEIKAVTDTVVKVEADAVIVNHYEGQKTPEGDAASIDKALGGAVARLIEQGQIKGKINEITVLHSLGKLPSGRVAIVGLGKKRELTADKIRGAVGETCRLLRKQGVKTIATVAQGADADDIDREKSAQAITEGAILGLYTFRRYITKKENDSGEIEQISILADEPKAYLRKTESYRWPLPAMEASQQPQLEQGIAVGKIIAEAVNWARDLVNEPSNKLTPTGLADAARQMAEGNGLQIEVLEPEQMVDLGMGGLLGVAQGSQQPPRFIILRYQGSPAEKIDIALVGKGITFDSGGISIKPSESMADMKGDMAGGAAVMATMMAVARLKPGLNVMAAVPATENMPSGGALKPGDIITAMNGKTVEVLNTDAEGRLILMDALSYANKSGAKAIVDIATLTGACMVALGKICTGAFTNNQRLIGKVLAAATEAGEYTWQLPMYDDYREYLKSDIADIKNIGNRYGGAITAAKFLAEFVGDTPWVHLDIAGPFESDKEKGYLVKGATGVPVRTLLNLVISMAAKSGKS